MRRLVVLAAALFGMALQAQAADMPDLPVLRGSVTPPVGPITRNWDGWYAGGQVGSAWTNTDYSNTVVSMTNEMFRSTTLQQPVSQFTLLGRVNGRSPGFGGFVGRNWQFDDIVMSAEANYTYFSSLSTFTTASLGPIQIAEPGLVLPPGATAADGVTLRGSAALRVKDTTTFRGRLGWATGDFLPYVFGGIAVGRMDVTRTVSSSVNRTIHFADGTSITVPLPQVSLTTTDARTDNFVPGWTAGLGMEYGLWGGLFLRGEWEYTKFLKVKDTTVTQNTVRAGIGYKF